MIEEDYPDREVTPALTVGEGDIDVSLRPRSLRPPTPPFALT